MEEFGRERNWRRTDVKGFQEEVALGLSSEGRAAEQAGVKALQKQVWWEGHGKCRRLGARGMAPGMLSIETGAGKADGANPSLE